MNVFDLCLNITFLVGLFSCIALHIYFKYKTRTRMSERVPLETFAEWYRNEAQARSQRSRSEVLRWGGFFVGLGLGTAIGCIIVACITLPDGSGLRHKAVGVFLVIALAMLCAGWGMIAAYFLERRLDKKK